MLKRVDDNLEAIRAICARFGVRRLDLFGSASTGRFDPAHSDIDFLVDLGPLGQKPTWHLIDLMLELESLLGYRVQLTDLYRLQDERFLAAISKDRVLIYERGVGRSAA